MNNNKATKIVPVPQRVFDSMVEAYQKWEKFSDEFEDFLLGSDKGFIEKMRQAREEHLKGNTRSLESLKQELK